MTKEFTVKWSKEFTKGPLKGLFYDSELSFPTLETACSYIAFLHAHKTIPVKAIGNDDYICHMARID